VTSAGSTGYQGARRRTGGQAVAATLAALGVERVFGIVSVHNAPIVDAIEAHDRIAFVPVRHEQSAVHAADALARVSGGLGVSVASTGPGTTNCMTGLLEAATASSPVLLITGQVPTSSYGKRRGALHEAERQVDMLRTVARDVASIATVEEIPGRLMDMARAALAGRRQPTAVEIPIDLQYAEAETAIPVASPPQPVGPPEDAVRQAAAILSESRRPLIYAGGGVIGADAADALRTLAERLGAPVLTTVNGRGSLSEDHPLALGTIPARFPQFAELLQKADVMLAVGTRFQGPATASWSLPMPARLLHLDIDPRVIGLNYRTELAMVGDARRGLESLARHLEPDVFRTDAGHGAWAASLRDRVRDAMRVEIGPDQAAIMDSIRAVAPPETVIVRDATLAAYLWADRLLPIHLPRTSIRPTTGSIGPGLAFAMGASQAAPTVLIVGDGGAISALGEIASIAEQGRLLVICLFNDGGYGILRAVQDRRFSRHAGVDLRTPDFVGLAQSVGMEASRVASAGQFASAFETAMRGFGPTLIEADVAALAPMDLSGIARD
jgi:acetolactate synthase-1/2/3 large subunit